MQKSASIKEELFSWSTMPVNSIMPCALEGHSLTLVPERSLLLLYGGLGSDKRNQVFCYQLKSLEWFVAKTSGTKPRCRAYHTANYDHSSKLIFFIFGKITDSSVNDVFALHTSSWIWYKLLMLVQPSPRHHHSAVQISAHQIYIFGGISYPLNTCSNELWVLNTRNNQVGDAQKSIVSNTMSKRATSTISLVNSVVNKERDDQYQIRGCEMILLKTKNSPPPLYGHNAYAHNSDMFLFAPSENKITLWQLRTSLSQWTQVRMIGGVPRGRRFFSLQKLQSELIIFGGMDDQGCFSQSIEMMYFQNMYWVKPFVEGVRPSPRNHQACCTHNQQLYMLGGIGRTYCPMHLYRLSKRENKGSWTKVTKPSEQETKALGMLNSMVMDCSHYKHYLQNLLNKQFIKQVQNHKEFDPLNRTMQGMVRYRREFMNKLQNDLVRVQDEAAEIQSQESLFEAYIQAQRKYCQAIEAVNDRLQTHLLSVKNYHFIKTVEVEFHRNQLLAETIKLNQQLSLREEEYEQVLKQIAEIESQLVESRSFIQ